MPGLFFFLIFFLIHLLFLQQQTIIINEANLLRLLGLGLLSTSISIQTWCICNHLKLPPLNILDVRGFSPSACTVLLNLITVVKPAPNLLWQMYRISFCYDLWRNYTSVLPTALVAPSVQWMAFSFATNITLKNQASSSQHYLNSYKTKQRKYQTSSKLGMNNFFYHSRSCWNTHKYSIWQGIAVKKRYDQSNKDLQVNLKMWSSSLSPYLKIILKSQSLYNLQNIK